MSGKSPIGAYGSTTRENTIHDRKPYQNTVDQAIAYAAERDMASAFDRLSRKTALALRGYIAVSYQEQHSYSDIENIRDDMKHYFEDNFGCHGTDWVFVPDQAGETVEGDQDQDEEQGQWAGNPVFDTDLVNLMQELQEKSKKAERARQTQRRTALGYDDMSKLMRHLQKPETIHAEGVGRCLLLQALASVAFTLWLTFDEVLQLKRGYIRLRQLQSDNSPWLEVTLPFRSSNPIESTLPSVYEIYSRPNEPHTCVVTKLLPWLQWMVEHKKNTLLYEDLLFPQITNDDQIQARLPYSVTQLSNLLNKHAKVAHLMDHRYSLLDPHCFRRGGAQYRLFHPQDPWPFKAIKWWGGWPETEPAEEIIEYLLDESRFDASFGDMLAPRGSETRGHSGMARHPAEVLVLSERFDSTIRSLESRHSAELARIEKEMQEIRRQNDNVCRQLDRVVCMMPSREPDSQRMYSQQPDPWHEPVQHLTEPAHRDQSQDWSSHSQHPQHQSPPPPLHRPQQHQAPPSPHRRQETQPPTQKKTPFLEPKIPFIRTWKEAIKQWDEGDPSTGLIPLSQWPLERQRSTRTYKDRQMIAQEFEYFGRSEARMRKVYGSDMDGVAKLRDAIRAKHKKLYQPSGEIAEEGSEEEKGEEDEEDDGDNKEQGGAQQEEAMEHGDDKPEVLNIPKVFHWKQVVRQWEDGDVQRGLTTPLREWTKAMIQGDSTYYERQTVYKEFEKFGCNEDRMREVYGDVIDGQMKHFMRAIRARNKAQRKKAKEGKQIAQQPVERDDNAVVDTTMPGEVAVIESEDGVQGDAGDDRHDFDSRRTNSRSSTPRQSNINNAHSLRDPVNPDDVSMQAVPRIRYWLEAVRQWEQGDPEHGLTVPIRDWPAEWRKEDKMRQVYGRRRTIAKEYELRGRDEARMRQVHGECLDRPNDLVLSIGRRRREEAQELAGAQSEERNDDDEEDAGEEETEEGVKEDEGEDEPLTRKRKSKAADDVETLSKMNKPSSRSSRSPLSNSLLQ
ncbi:hypothetical protein MVEG_01605 [Podila verticillata NRRL 6337]|nr:hypothetical protein MVEG_01605 [Podila verticillata NRRL 6337]